MSQAKTMVVKLGTSVLTRGAPGLDQAHMLELVRSCARVRRDGHRIILVSSGAIAAGRERLGSPTLPPTVASKQMLAAVGQIQLIRTWERLFSIYGLRIGQMLLTRADLEDRERFLNARDLLQALLENGIIPVINENDAVATAEIKVGDNDNLSALAAILADADLLLLLTDQDGLYTADPRSDPEARLIPAVQRIDEAIHRLAGGSGSGQGTGGMITKIQAARMAVRAGVAVVIAAGARPEVLEDVLAGRSVGTFFPAESSPLERRKRWLYGAPPSGELRVDSGAAAALTEGKRSLLPRGVTGVSGAFSRGEVVRILDPSGGELARGTVRYNSDALGLIAGRHSAEIRTILGYAHGPVAVHRNDLILTGEPHGH
jgi:glutamate 5-kinase